ncbi:MAG: HlyD family efflux transporter periplasmic adaptor subunit [Steroidobacteraceae bacterium]
MERSLTVRPLEPLALLPLLLTLSACGNGPSGALPGTLERDRIELAAEAAEPILERPVREGAIVRAGDVIIVQDATVAGTQLDAARAAVARAAAQLRELENGARIEARREARARRDAARAQRDAEARELARLQGLIAQNLVSQSQLTRQQAASDAAASGLAAAEAALATLENGTRAEQVEQGRRSLEQARAQLRELETSAGRLQVRAPIAGIVDALPYQLGERPPRGATVAVLLADGAPFARIYVPEPLRAQVHVGTPARVHVDGVEGVFRGNVRFVASQATFTPYFSLNETDRSRLAFLAEVTLAEPRAATIGIGVPVQVELEPGGTP